MNEGIVAMNQRELQRLSVIEAVLAKRTSQTEAASCLGLSTRQVRRLQHRLRGEGPKGLAHKSRGQPARYQLPKAVRSRVIGLIQVKYTDFGPTLAAEKLEEAEGIQLSRETLRQWMRQEGILNGRRRRRPHRQWRERSACLGQMIQVDGSHHDWLEGRGPRLVLMGYIDDATGRAWARFYPGETREAAFDSFKRYCRLYGIPQSVYLDKHKIYRSPKEQTVEEQLKQQDSQSQFERALSELGVNVIHANSPQAKGRIERLFRTLQDRLVKEMRLSRIRTLPEANKFLPGFLARFNRRFSRAPRQPGNLHRPAPAGDYLSQVLCVKQQRIVANDETIQINGQKLQLIPPGLRPLAKKGVTVTISPTGVMRVLSGGRQIPYRSLPLQLRPKPKLQTPELPRVWKRYVPPPGHCWRQFKLNGSPKTSKPSRPLKPLRTLNP